MSKKIALLFLVFFVAVQVSSAVPFRERRDTPTEPKKESDPLESIQNFFKENFQFDKVADNLKELGEKISTGTKEFAETVQQKAGEIFNSNNSPPKTT